MGTVTERERATRLLGAPLRSHASARGSVVVWRPAPGVFVTRVVGHLDEAGAREIEGAFRRQIAEEGRHVGFNDWFDMTDYDSQARILLTEMVNESIALIEASHVLIASKLVAFGVRAANVVLRRHLTVYSDPEAFDRELRRVMARDAARSSSASTRK
jgi:hypothetical protein